jgi:outer membrane protein OmpA-like peptidoglycan-associated protein
MTTSNINKMESRKKWFLKNLFAKQIFTAAFMLTGLQCAVTAQQAQYSKPSWWFGAAAAANINFYRGSTQQLNSSFSVPVAFHDGKGAGLYVAPLIEFHKPNTVLGAMLQVGYDSRKSKFKQVITPCNCPADLSTKLSYVTVEPSIRIAPFKSNFYLYGGPRLAFNMNKSFVYQLGINPSFPLQTASPEVTGDFDNVNKTLISMQVGAGYDIPLSNQSKQTQVVLSPFVSFQPYFGQSPRTVETWNITTVRAGAALKFGSGHKIAAPLTELPAATAIKESEVIFTVNAPQNIPAQRIVREIFPVRNYVFFNAGSAAIPDRYVLLNKDQVKSFKEEQLELFVPKNLSGRSERQMIIYYNVLNILGDRMGKNPATIITLVGSSEKGADDGKAMATSIKQYLTDVFAINAARIGIEGRSKPKIPSLQPGGTNELVLLREGDQRVSIESSSLALLMEFQSGPDAPLKPVELVAVQDAPLDSYVTFTAAGAKEAYTSWSMEIADTKGAIQNFGPYTEEKISLPGKTIMGATPAGDYKVTMIGQTKTGQTVRKESTVPMVLWTPAKDEEGMRYSVIFEFNESKTIGMYETYLSNIVTPKIPTGGTVIIHGHTDIIGDEAYNKTLSMDRANEVKSIIEKSLTKSGRSDVKFEVYGFGEDQKLSPFENKYPEERFYNRTVIIDIIPAK